MRSRANCATLGAQGVDVVAESEVEIFHAGAPLSGSQDCRIVGQSDSHVNSNRKAVSTAQAPTRRSIGPGAPPRATAETPPLFEPVEREPAYTRVSAAIEQKILSRALRDGDVLPAEVDLAQQFRVHRSTVREALRQLESAGLVTRPPGAKRMIVSRPAAAKGRFGNASGAGPARRVVRRCVGSDDGDRAGSRGARGDAPDAGGSARRSRDQRAFREFTERRSGRGQSSWRSSSKLMGTARAIRCWCSRSIR